MSRFERSLLAVGAVAVALILAFVIIAQPGCASSPEVREARRAAAVQTAQRLAQCAVAGGLTCAPETAALVGCAINNGLDCKSKRATWGQCLAAQAVGCGVATVVGLMGAGEATPDTIMSDGCAAGAADLCADLAGDAPAVEACLAESLVPCVD